MKRKCSDTTVVEIWMGSHYRSDMTWKKDTLFEIMALDLEPKHLIRNQITLVFFHADFSTKEYGNWVLNSLVV